VALAAHSNAALLAQQAQEFNVRHLALGNAALANQDLQLTLSLPKGAQLAFGEQSVAALAELPEVDIVVNALVGAAGLDASYRALKAGKILALANKESLVVGGDLLMPLVTASIGTRFGSPADTAAGFTSVAGPANGSPTAANIAANSAGSPTPVTGFGTDFNRLRPIDSEHGAIWQCLVGENPRDIARLWITASGGPFRGRRRAELQDITAAQALAHPTWQMGPKITIDSATLMNKGLEVIEAHHLFNMSYAAITPIVHPQSCIHSMIEFIDGSVKAHLGVTDMRIPIQYALSYPERLPAPLVPLDLLKLGELTFDEPDTSTFRCLSLAIEAGRAGGTLPCVLNAANEIAVAAFLAGRCGFLDIERIVEQTLERHDRQPVESLDQLQITDTQARQIANTLI
jgi:1-deoxy-D-xylulose-5-phosphate reductoisomerase